MANNSVQILQFMNFPNVYAGVSDALQFFVPFLYARIMNVTVYTRHSSGLPDVPDLVEQPAQVSARVN